MQVAEQIPGIDILRFVAVHAGGNAHKVGLLLGRNAPLVGKFVGDGHRQKHRRAVHVQSALPQRRKDVPGEIRGAHHQRIHRRLGPALRPGQKGILLRHALIQAPGVVQDVPLFHRKAAGGIPRHIRGGLIHLPGKPSGGVRQLLGRHRLGG